MIYRVLLVPTAVAAVGTVLTCGKIGGLFPDEEYRETSTIVFAGVLWITTFVHMLFRPSMRDGKLQFWLGWIGTGVLYGLLGNLSSMLVSGGSFSLHIFGISVAAGAAAGLQEAFWRKT